MELAPSLLHMPPPPGGRLNGVCTFEEAFENNTKHPSEGSQMISGARQVTTKTGQISERRIIESHGDPGTKSYAS